MVRGKEEECDGDEGGRGWRGVKVRGGEGCDGKG